MEEVDKIILLNIKELGVYVCARCCCSSHVCAPFLLSDALSPSELDDSVKGLGDLKAEELYPCALACLRAIEPKRLESFPSTLPRPTSQRVNVTSEFANIIKVPISLSLRCVFSPKQIRSDRHSPRLTGTWLQGRAGLPPVLVS